MHFPPDKSPQILHLLFQRFLLFPFAHVWIEIGKVAVTGNIRASAAGGTGAFAYTAVIDLADGDIHIRGPEGFPGYFTATRAISGIFTGIVVRSTAGESHV